MEKCLSLRNQNPLPEEKNVKNVIIPKTCIAKADASISPLYGLEYFWRECYMYLKPCMHVHEAILGLWCVLSTS